jgi:Mg2+/Co2+ transporter CorC
VSVGGLVTKQLGRVPVQGDAVEWNGCRFEVLAASKRQATVIAIKIAGNDAQPAV